MRDAFWQDVCCSALLLLIVPLCEQQTFTGKLALFCTSGLISEGCSLPGCVLQCTLPVNVGAATFQTDMAVPEAWCQAVICTAALISGGCMLPGSVLHCTVVRHCLFEEAAYFHR